MLKELAVERYRFSCAGCGHTWMADYDVQHVEDGHGQTWEYYALNGLPCPVPTGAGAVNCPWCGATWLHVELVAAREVPLPRTDDAEANRHRQAVDAERRAARRTAPPLRGDQAESASTPLSGESTSIAGTT
jgi:hypothetical protein